MQSSYFFNSRANNMLVYSAEDFAKYFSNMLTNGVIKHKNSSAMKVEYASDYTVSVTDGGAVINGYQFFCEGETLQAQLLSSGTIRYDRVMLKLDLNDEVNAIVMYIKPGSSTSPPEPERNETIYELSLAQLAITVDGITVTDERDDAQMCGICRFIVETPMHDGMVFGTYTGDGAAERFIDLGFTPTAVEIYSYCGEQYNYCTNSASKDFYGGLAVAGNPCFTDRNLTIAEIVTGGFKIFNQSYNSSSPDHNVRTNEKPTKYYFIAYRNFEIMEVE